MHVQQSENGFALGFVGRFADRATFGCQAKRGHPSGVLFFLESTMIQRDTNESSVRTVAHRIKISFIPSIDGISRRMMYFRDER